MIYTTKEMIGEENGMRIRKIKDVQFKWFPIVGGKFADVN